MKRLSNHCCGILACVAASSSALNAGFAIGFSSPAIQDLQAGMGSITLSTEGATWFGSLLPLAAMWGSLLSGPLMDHFGRRTAVLTVVVCFLIGWIAIFFSSGYILLFSGRGLSGLATGMSTAVIPVYISEVSPSFLRGTMGTTFSALLAMGLPLGYAAGIFYNWRNLAELGAILGCMTFIICFMLPESPYWLVRQNKIYEATECLKKIRGKIHNVAREIKEIQYLQEELSLPVTRKEIMNRAFLKPVGLGVALMVFQQFSGINAIFVYAHEVFHRANFHNESLASIVISSMQVAVLLLVTLITDRIGRRKLLLVSGLGMMICHGIVGGCMYILSNNKPMHGHENLSLTSSPFFEPEFRINATTIDSEVESSNTSYHNLRMQATDKSVTESKLLGDVHAIVQSDTRHVVAVSWLCLLFLVLYITLYSVGFGPLPYIVMSEMLPQRGRGVASGVGTMSNWTCAFILTKTFVSLTDFFSASGIFWIFSFICMLSVVFVGLCVPETRGKTLWEIQGIFNNNNNPANQVKTEKPVASTPLRIIHRAVTASPVPTPKRSPSVQEQTQNLMDAQC